MGADDSSQVLLAPLRTWARTLPDLAADVVTDADLTKPYLYLSVRATPSLLASLRSRVREWTHAVGMSSDDREDIVMAVDEAIANAVEHAFPSAPGIVTVFAASDRLARVVHVIVSDNGTWRTSPSAPGTRGRGLRMMDRLADLFDLYHDDRGTTVVLRWALFAIG